MDLCAQFFNAGSDIRRADAQGIRLSCRVNISKNYRIRCGKCLSELIQECLGTGISMWLGDTPELFMWIIMCCL